MALRTYTAEPVPQTLFLTSPPYYLTEQVGIDLCGDPSRRGIEALAPAFEEARAVSGLGITLHFAEAKCSSSDEELDMLLAWRPDRIGHVIHISDAVRSAIVARGGLGLELCLSCNVHAGLVSGGFEGQYVVSFLLVSLRDLVGSPWQNTDSCRGSHFGEWWRVEDCIVTLGVSVLWT